MPEIKQDIRGATFVVAANDSLHKNMADYVCGGVNDHLVIQAALDALPATGGKIVLLDGTYNLAAAIVITKVIELAGSGWNTILFLTNDTNTNVIEIGDGSTTLNRVVIKDLAIDGNRANNAAGTTRGIEMIGAGGTPVTKARIDHVYITSCHDHGICGLAGGDGDYSLITDCEVTDCADDGIYFSAALALQIKGNYVHDIVNGDGIHVYDRANVIRNLIYTVGFRGIYVNSYSTVSDNYICATTDIGIKSQSDCTVDANVLYQIGAEGITAFSYTVVSNNILYITGEEGILMIGSHGVVTGNFIGNAGYSGISTAVDYIIIADNLINAAGQAGAGAHHGIYLEGAADRCSITGNIIVDYGTKTEDGVRLGDGATSCVINDNYCYNLMGSGIYLLINNDDCVITGNICELNDDYGIRINAAACNRNIVKNNKFIGNITGQFRDDGTDTQLATYVVPFSHGTDPQDSGFLIDADTEMARAWLRLPPEVQQVVRMKVYARSAVAELHEMELQMVVKGGADNQPFGTHDGSIAQLDSISVNFAADDIIFWINTEAGTLALVGGDSVEVKVLHEAVEGDNIDTQAYFRTVEIEYV